jgi:hypothetical protein
MDNVLTNTLPCKTSTGSIVNVTIRSFPPNCPKINYNNTCSTANSAYLPAITVCRQGLYA